MMKQVVLVLGLAWPCACGPAGELGGAQQVANGNPADPDPNITFNQVGLGVGSDRSREPASSGPDAGSGAHTLVARASDAAGNTTDSAPIAIQP